MTTHDRRRTKEYRIWRQMKKSCYTPSFPQYKNYGKKGFKICSRWLNDFSFFMKDMGCIPNDCTGICLIDMEKKIYEPGNTKWNANKRGRLKKKNIENSEVEKHVKMTINIEMDLLDILKRYALRKSIETGKLVEPSEIIINMIKKEICPPFKDAINAIRNYYNEKS